MPQIGRGMDAFENQPCIGMFGTCGPTTFRPDIFIPRYEVEDVNYFNPQLPEGTWVPEDAEDEADHLVYDMVQTWPATQDTYAGGTLAEQGYSLSASLSSDSPLPKFIIPMIVPTLSEDLTDEVARNESIRARKLAITHLNRSSAPNVFPVESFDHMLETSIALYGAARAIMEVYKQGYNPAFNRFVEGRKQKTAFAEAVGRGLIPEAQLS